MTLGGMFLHVNIKIMYITGKINKKLIIKKNNISKYGMNSQGGL